MLYRSEANKWSSRYLIGWGEVVVVVDLGSSQGRAHAGMCVFAGLCVRARVCVARPAGDRGEGVKVNTVHA